VNVGVESVSEVLLSQDAGHTIREAIAHHDGCELCGFLLGWGFEPRTQISVVRPAKNIFQSDNSFAISEREYLSVLDAETNDRHLLGVYHTHFGRAHASSWDRKNITVHPLLWLIVGVLSGRHGLSLDWKCFKPVGGKAKELRVSILG
jgi:proteasome lid subunit RPN8/RPN11